MHHYMCLGEKILHSISEQELPLELLDVEPVAKFGYQVISTDGDEILLPVLVDGDIEYRRVQDLPVSERDIHVFGIIANDPHMRNGVTAQELELMAWLQGVQV